jgi:hypothetical protein
MTSADRRNRVNTRPRFIFAAVAIVTACTAWLGLSASSDALGVPVPPDTCLGAGKTLARDGQALVYSVPIAIEKKASTPQPRPVNVFGCSLRTGKAILLGSTAIDLTGAHMMIDSRIVVLSGSRVAYSLTEGGEDFNQVYVALRNLVTGKVERRPNAGPGPLGPENFSKVTKIGVNKAGAFAWISTGSSIGGDSADEVAAVNTTGEEVVFDTAADIDLHSLKLQGDRLSWTDGGAPHSAVLH